MTLGLGTNAFAAQPQDSENMAKNDIIALSTNLSNYFEKDDLGNVNFTASLDELMVLGISEQDALIMLSLTSGELAELGDTIDSSLIIKEDTDNKELLTRGFVGLKLE